MRKLILTLLACASITCVFSQEIIKVAAAKHNDYGLVYSLPKTELNISVEATKFSCKAGPYYKYAEKYLGVTEVVTEDAQYWMLDKVNVTPVGVSDKNQSYFVKFKSSAAPYMYLTKDGVLLSINAEPILEDTVSILKTKKTDVKTIEAIAAMTEEQLMAGSTAKMAEMASKQIFRIRESRMNIITGEVDKLPADGESFKLVMKQLDEQEQALVSMFVGTIKTEKATFNYQITPESDLKNEVPFRFSKFLGVVDKNDLSGVPVYLNLNITERGELPEAAKKKSDGEKGIAYCVAGKADVEITMNNKSLFSKNMQFAQFGSVYRFEASMFDDKKAPAKATFYPSTGAVREIGQ